MSPTPPPTKHPTSSPTRSPTPQPTSVPTQSPTFNPTASPTRQPTLNPTRAPTPYPTPEPTIPPTTSPSPLPTSTPTASPKRTGSPLGVVGFGEGDSPTPKTVIITPVADATVRAGSYSQTNRGREDEMMVKENIYGGALLRRSFVKFDLDALASVRDVDEAIMEFTVSHKHGEIESFVELFQVEDNSWNQYTITWSNAPDFDSSAPLTPAQRVHLQSELSGLTLLTNFAPCCPMVVLRDMLRLLSR